MIGKALGAAAVVVAAVVVMRMGEDETTTVEYSACQNVPPDHHVHIGKELSLYLPSNGQPLNKGRVYELTYVVGDGRITSARDVRQATCNG